MTWSDADCVPEVFPDRQRVPVYRPLIIAAMAVTSERVRRGAFLHYFCNFAHRTAQRSRLPSNRPLSSALRCTRCNGSTT
jgi:hypothetical protein